MTGVGRDSFATNGLFTLRNRPILMNLSRGIKTHTPLYWSKNISTDLRDSRGWSIWFEKNGIPGKNGKITSLYLDHLNDFFSHVFNSFIFLLIYISVLVNYIQISSRTYFTKLR